MKFLGFLLLIVIVVLGVGYYLDWFKFSTASQGEKANISLEVDKHKFNEDREKATEKIKEFGSQAQEKAKNVLPGKSDAKDKQPATTP